MSMKRAYRRTSVKKVCGEELIEACGIKGSGGTSVGLDIGKEEIVAVVRWPDGTYESPWSVKNPSEIPELMSLLKSLAKGCQRLTVGLESTGTYGEAIRSAMTIAGLEVHRVSGKASSDYKEIFDGVPSQHDGKDAAIISELTAFGKGTPWPFELESEESQEIAHQVHRLDAFNKQGIQWAGRLEALLAKHWPELGRELSLTSVTLLECLMHYGSPQRMLADPQAAAKLRQWGRSGLKEPTIDKIIESARTSCGVPLGEAQTRWIQEVADELAKSLREARACEKRLEELMRRDET